MKLMSKYNSAATSVGRWPLFRKLRLVVIGVGIRGSGLGARRLARPGVRERVASADHDA